MENENRTAEAERRIRETTHGLARMLAALLLGMARLIAPVAVVVVFGLIAKYAYTSIEHLGAVHFRATPQVAQIGAIVTVGITTLMMVFLAGFEASHAARGIVVVFLVAWLLLTVVLTLTDTAMSSGVLSVPPEITNAGTFLFAGLAGITLIPATLIPIVAARAPSDKYANTFQGAMGMMGVAVKFVSIAAGILAELFFGLHYGVNPLYTVVASMVIGFGLLWAMGRISEAQHRGDLLDIGMWIFVSVVFGAYLVMISAESVQTLAGWQLFGEGFDRFAKTAYALSLGVFTVLFLLTFAITSVFDVRVVAGKVRMSVPVADTPPAIETAAPKPALIMARDEALIEPLDESKREEVKAPKVTRRKQPTPSPSEREGG